MPMNKDPELGGTEKDGSKSKEYCSYCYKDGEFTAPHIKTGKEMQDFCYNIMREKGMNRVLAWLFTRSIPKLKRWKNTGN